MKIALTLATLVCVTTGVGSASAQWYGYEGGGYRDRGYGYEDRGYRSRGYDYEERRGGYGRRGGGFDESEYLRCNPDVRRAVNRGQFNGSGLNHYREYGQYERRRLSC
jgi:hypothetical protein